jgi:hypothetical protein
VKLLYNHLINEHKCHNRTVLVRHGYKSAVFQTVERMSFKRIKIMTLYIRIHKACVSIIFTMAGSFSPIQYHIIKRICCLIYTM